MAAYYIHFLYIAVFYNKLCVPILNKTFFFFSSVIQFSAPACDGRELGKRGERRPGLGARESGGSLCGEAARGGPSAASREGAGAAPAPGSKRAAGWRAAGWRAGRRRAGSRSLTLRTASRSSSWRRCTARWRPAGSASSRAPRAR